MKDLAVKILRHEEQVENVLIKRKEFEDLRITTIRLKERVEDDMDLVTRNVREAKDRMGEMTTKFRNAFAG